VPLTKTKKTPVMIKTQNEVFENESVLRKTNNERDDNDDDDNDDDNGDDENEQHEEYNKT